MSPALGESFTHSGFLVLARIARDAVAGVVLVHREVAAGLVAGRARDVGLDHVDVRHAQLFGERGEILDGLRRSR